VKAKNSFILLGLLAVLGLVLPACQTPSGPAISVEDAWGRPSPKVATAGAIYMRLRNTGGEDDSLISGTSPSCGLIEMHESYDMGEGVMGMRPVEAGGIEIPSGRMVELKVGGLHLMCLKKLDDFQEGTILSLTLEFQKSGERTVEVEIRQPDM